MKRDKGDIILILDIVFIIVFLIIGIMYLFRGYFMK